MPIERGCGMGARLAGVSATKPAMRLAGMWLSAMRLFAMRLPATLLSTMLLVAGCHKAVGPQAAESTAVAEGQVVPVPPEATASHAAPATAATGGAAAAVSPAAATAAGEYLGMDRNEYPGDAKMAALRANFSFTGYWLTVPPGAEFNEWVGKRAVLRAQGWGFLLLANGRLETQILASAKGGTTPAALARADAARATAAAKSEGFPAGATIFLDQEEGGRLTGPQAVYLLAWTEAVAAGAYRAGVYASGQLVSDDPGTQIDTVRDIRARIAAGHLHPVAIFDTQDACPPAPGCTLAARPLSTAGEPDLAAWQYSQSPRRPAITASCAATYAADGNCYAPAGPGVFLDMSVARSADPSGGR